MTTYDRESLKANFQFLIDFIQLKHVVNKEVTDELFVNNVPVKGLCHTHGYFVMVDEFYIHYTMDHIIQEPDLMLVGRSVQSVTFYDNFLEFEAARVKTLGASKTQVGLNLN